MTNKERKNITSLLESRMLDISDDLPFTKKMWREAYNKALEDVGHIITGYYLQKKGYPKDEYGWNCFGCNKYQFTKELPPLPQYCKSCIDKQLVPEVN